MDVGILPALKGQAGSRGPQGVMGPKGYSGHLGPTGTHGAVGRPGPEGESIGHGNDATAGGLYRADTSRTKTSD